jgi:hypothetical protein
LVEKRRPKSRIRKKEGTKKIVKTPVDDPIGNNEKLTVNRNLEHDRVTDVDILSIEKKKKLEIAIILSISTILYSVSLTFVPFVGSEIPPYVMSLDIIDMLSVLPVILINALNAFGSNLLQAIFLDAVEISLIFSSITQFIDFLIIRSKIKYLTI